MKTCSFIGQKPPEQCHLIYFVNLPAGSQNEETILLENALVGDKPVYAFPSQSSSLLAQHGHSIYGLFETVVMLSENIRQAGNNPEAEQFRAILIRLRDGQTNQDEWMTLSEDTTARKHE